MHIGIDFDNTIANYTGVFYQVALDLGWLPAHIGSSKKEVKSHFIEQGMEPKWTELQGIVYGKEILKAKPYENCLAALKQLKADGHKLSIISHKTQYPIIGDKVDFHIAATRWLTLHGFIGKAGAPVEVKDVYFNQTQELKVKKIATLNCDIFIDDLPSIFQHAQYPSNIISVLFSTDKVEGFQGKVLNNWSLLNSLL